MVAAPPGSPFYDARVYLETITLPARGDARLQGHERLLQERLAEAESAATRADGVGLAAALAAYQAEVDAATTDAGDDAALLAHLEEVLATHTDVLTELASRLPDQAAIEHAIDASSKAIDKIKNRVPPDHPSHPSGGSQNQGQGPR